MGGRVLGLRDVDVAVAVVVVVVVVLNATCFVQELQAERAVEAFQEFLSRHAKVRRDGSVRTVEARCWPRPAAS